MYSVAAKVAVYATASAVCLYVENRKLRKKLNNVIKIVEAQSKMILYMSDLLDRHNVPIREFDAIAFDAITKEATGGSA